MKNLKKKLALLAAVTMAGTIMAGCGDTGSSSSGGNSGGGDAAPAPAADNGGAADAGASDGGSAGGSDVELKDDGDKLRILCWTVDDLNPMIKEFCAHTDYTEDQIEVVMCGTNGGEANEQYEQWFLGSEDCDLFVAEADWILKYINMDMAAPLSALGFSDSDFSGCYPYTVAIGKDNNGVLKGASWQSAAGGFVYRSDLAESYLNVTSPDDMQAKIGDWGKFKAAAAEIKEASGGKTSMTATVGGTWQVFAANRNVPWVKDNKLQLDNAGEFADLMKEFKDNSYVTSVSQWTDAWYQAGQDDSAFGYFLSTWGIKDTDTSVLYNVEGGEGGPTYGKYALCVGPTNYFWGGSWLVPATRCDNKTMAADFVKYFTVDASTMQSYAEASGDFVNNKAAMQAIVDAGTNSNKLLGGQDHFKVLIDAAAGIKMDGLITEYDSTVKSKFLDSVNEYLNGDYGSTDDTLNAFQDKVAAAYPNLSWD